MITQIPTKYCAQVFEKMVFGAKWVKSPFADPLEVPPPWLSMGRNCYYKSLLFSQDSFIVMVSLSYPYGIVMVSLSYPGYHNDTITIP